ncbi:hypothetical protein C1H84_16255 [Glutamicibacter soli]|uniref:Uncharacterized protein n=1 Tax=Glutamicibacter soli TaxID=453836 RepID=A0A365YA19_9MICC|nr:hypothetical protein [Glutamicibacter soli]RBL99236.1 hypothetical protein C1H84_16255 [Glutamicibacter soli]
MNRIERVAQKVESLLGNVVDDLEFTNLVERLNASLTDEQTESWTVMAGTSPDADATVFSDGSYCSGWYPGKNAHLAEAW